MKLRVHAAMLCWLAVGCADHATSPANKTTAKNPTRPVASAGADADAYPSGVLTGYVVLKQPKQRAPARTDACGVSRPAVVDGHASGVEGAFVWLKHAPAPFRKEQTVSFMDCRVVPAGAVGSRFFVTNDDGIRHQPTVSAVNLADGAWQKPLASVPMPLLGQKFELPIKEPGIYRLACQLHKGEGAWLMVPEHVHAAATDKNGKFELPLAPTGTAHVVAVYPGSPPERANKTVEISEGRVTSIDLQLEW